MRIGIVWVISSTMHSTTDEAIFHSCLKRMIYRLTDGMRWSRNPLSMMKKILRMKGIILLLVKCCSFGICLELSRTKFL
jgi:hypothetical protein